MRRHIARIWSISVALGAALVAPSLCNAQNIGYITGGNWGVGFAPLTSFDASTGAIVNSFPFDGGGTQFAVANDDSTLYMPTSYPDLAALNVVSGQTGQVLNYVPVGPATMVILSSDGATAYVGSNGGVTVVDTATVTVTTTLSLQSGARPTGLALSPDNQTLYVSSNCVDCNPPGQAACPPLNGLCIFDTSTWELKGQVNKLSGDLRMSRDGQSLYIRVTIGARNGKEGDVYVLNTSSLAVSGLRVPYVGEVEIDPFEHWAVVFASLVATNPPGVAAYILNTSTNQFAARLFGPAPGNTIPASAWPSRFAAFAPDGKSIWMLLTCGPYPQPDCTTPGGAKVVLTGVAIPSGQVISQTPVPDDSTDIAFPQ